MNGGLVKPIIEYNNFKHKLNFNGFKNKSNNTEENEKLKDDKEGYIHFSNSFDNIHKFFDTNYSFFLGPPSKIHYSFLSHVEINFNHKYYDKALSCIISTNKLKFNHLALNDCIKQSQYQVNHEALIKCFLWMQKINRNLGNYNKVKLTSIFLI